MTAHQPTARQRVSARSPSSGREWNAPNGRYLRDKAKSVAATGGSCIEYADSVEGVA